VGRAIRLITFNVQHGRRIDGEIDHALLADTCASFDADVLALQEVDVFLPRSHDVDQAALVAERCGMRHVFGPAVPHYGNALLARGEIGDVEIVDLPFTPEREPRSAILARTCGVTVAATHLGLRGDARLQLPVLLAALLDRPGPHVLLGDLNLEREDVDVEPLALVDAAPTFPSMAPTRRIDHVATSGLTVSRVAVLRRPPVSDHRPLLVETTSP
jgi:endonuclease/exonuclease/phosphatase family metal-dependent hydrolase